jgi:23S rRNA (pseudouridine1915-N3)-methyltransferase
VKLVIAAVGTRMPGWVEEGFADYARRMPRELPLELMAVKAEPRGEGKTVEAMMAAEALRLRAALRSLANERCRTIALDERGTELTTQNLAQRLQRWMNEGGDTAFLIGGPDGLDSALKREAVEQVRLSGLTLPHAMVRVMLAEALYRAASVIRGHPYHRE